MTSESPGTSEFTTEEDALRALRDGELRGELAFGAQASAETSTFYVTYKVSARAGDVIRAKVTSNDNKLTPILWVTNTRGKSENLESDMNLARAASANVTYTAPTTGEYYLTYRDIDARVGRFTLSLAARAEARRCDPEEQVCPEASTSGSVGSKPTENSGFGGTNSQRSEDGKSMIICDGKGQNCKDTKVNSNGTPIERLPEGNVQRQSECGNRSTPVYNRATGGYICVS